MLYFGRQEDLEKGCRECFVETSILNIMPIVSCFKRLSMQQPYTLAQPAQHSCCFLSRTSFVLAPLGLKEMEMSAMQANSIGKKIFTSQSIKPLHQAVSSPMSPHYGGLIWKPVWPRFLFNNVRVTIKKKILLSSRLQRKSVLQLVPWSSCSSHVQCTSPRVILTSPQNFLTIGI